MKVRRVCAPELYISTTSAAYYIDIKNRRKSDLPDGKCKDTRLSFAGVSTGVLTSEAETVLIQEQACQPVSNSHGNIITSSNRKRV
jgi:hypothetical protein